MGGTMETALQEQLKTVREQFDRDGYVIVRDVIDQDLVEEGSYWPLEPMEVVTLWLALDDSTPENGCMRVIPGTQGMELQEMKPRTDVDNVLSSGMDVSSIDESKAVDLIL